MQNHVEHIVSLRRPMQHEMPLHLQHSLLQHAIPALRNPLQYALDLRYPLDRYLYRKLAPVQDVGERRGVVHGYDHWDAPREYRLHDPRARDFVAAGAQAELGLGHEVVVVPAFRQVLVDDDLLVFLPPVAQEELPDVAVGSAGEEREDRAVVGRAAVAGRRPGEAAVGEVHLGERHVRPELEALGGVRVADHTDRVLVELRIGVREVRSLKIKILNEVPI